MSDQQVVRELEQSRREAQLAADVATLDRLFADDIVWIHASGRADTKVWADHGDGWRAVNWQSTGRRG